MEAIVVANNGENNENSRKDGDDGENTLASKHRKERKELQAKIQSLKKSASKGDKKKRKEILEEISKLEINLEKRQAEELNEFNHAKSVENKTSKENKKKDENLEKNAVGNGKGSNGHNGGQQSQHEPKISKAQRRRDRKAKEEMEREAEILIQEELNKSGPRMTEMKTIRNLLKARGLMLHSIPSDGNCLYNAVIHQLELNGIVNYDISKLRNETANYILQNKANLISYMTNAESGNILTDEEFEEYCKAIRTTSAWGGQVEVEALSHIVHIPIEVLQATGPSTIQGGNESGRKPLLITYHRHLYSLGEHYNSTKPLIEGDEDDNNAEESRESD